MNKKAFSLIELSVVILIIGILIAGVTQSSRLIRRFQLTSAQSLTRGSPINSIKGVVGWWESTSEESFGNAEPEEDEDGGANGIATWYDINPQSSIKNNATSATEDNNPGYSFSNSINNLPTLYFNGTSSYLNFDGTAIAQHSDYTIFVVEQRASAFGMGMMVSSSSGTAEENRLPQFGYRDDENLTWGSFENDYDITVDAFSVPIPRIHAYIFNKTADDPKIYRINSVAQTLNDTYSSAVPELSIESYPLGSFGFYGPETSYYNGNIGEIVIFNRALKNEEVNSVEDYLSKKWKIKLD